MMKKNMMIAPWFIILVLIISLFTFNSCVGDDDTPQPIIPLDDIVVELTRSKDTIRVGESVNYEFGGDAPINGTSFAWSFNGGTPASSTEFNPTITYATAGAFEASLAVTRAIDNKEFNGEMATNLVVLDTAMSSFVANIRVIDEGGQVTFMNTGTADATLSWTFEGGSPATSTESEVTVTYTTPGVYDVTLASTLNGTTNTNVEADYIEVNPILASFTANNTTITKGQTVTYTNTSTDGSTLLWTFEGGSPATSTQSEVTVTYGTAGIYDVSLAATKNGITKTIAETDYITVNEPTPATFVSAESSEDGSQIVITYDQPLNDPSAESITVMVDAVNSPVASVALDGTDAKKIVVTLTTPFNSPSAVITATYAAPGITTTGGGTVPVLTDQAVVNNFVSMNASFVSAESSTNGSQIIITYDQPLNDPSGETITVSVNGMNSPVTSIALDPADAKKIVVMLTTAVAVSSDMITVTYATPGITTTSSGTVAALTGQAVVNNVPALMNLFINPGFENPFTIGTAPVGDINGPLTWFNGGVRPQSTAGVVMDVVPPGMGNSSDNALRMTVNNTASFRYIYTSGIQLQEGRVRLEFDYLIPPTVTGGFLRTVMANVPGNNRLGDTHTIGTDLINDGLWHTRVVEFAGTINSATGETVTAAETVSFRMRILPDVSVPSADILLDNIVINSVPAP